MTLNKEEHLQSVLETHKMAHIEELLTKYKSKSEDVKETLNDKYSSNIYSPFNSGSYAKHTAINCKFDLDIVVPFKRNSFSTLEDMFEDVFSFLEEKYKEVAIVRKQKVSIGVIFNSDEDGDIINIDIVPGRELTQDDYSISKDLNLFFNEGMGLFAKNSYLKTNIQAQIDHIKAKETERKIIRLLKIWKYSNSEKYKSFLLELITIKAYEKDEISGNLWEKLKGVMEYIKENVIKDDFKLKDPGNNNNDVIETLESWERNNLSDRMDTMIKQIESNAENIKFYFPMNQDFESSYGIKGAIVEPSIPSNNQRFGHK
jgi:hypothetical protein